jgi:hypothetical protein
VFDLLPGGHAGWSALIGDLLSRRPRVGVVTPVARSRTYGYPADTTVDVVA